MNMESGLLLAGLVANFQLHAETSAPILDVHLHAGVVPDSARDRSGEPVRRTSWSSRVS